MDENKKEKEIKRQKDEYRHCSLCRTAYMNMLRISLKMEEPDFIYLCKNCLTELQERLSAW